MRELSPGVTTKVGLTPAVAKFLLAKSKGEDVVDVNSATLGLKSRVSDALNPPTIEGILFLNLSAEYEFTV